MAWEAKLVLQTSFKAIIVHGFYEDHEGRDVVPGEPEECVGIGAGHVLDVAAEPLHAVDPHDGHALEEGDVHQGEGGGVVVHNLEVINATLE